ncbi:signal peptidase I [Oerskovia enterophila]|uniref:Signal peptidase I n=1 Tax=Oerskovia enterophila TaxID=43678 RepID=A0A163PSS1_9CELL|nr:signal peptidase I [Oerskovia enterophila]KZM33479.1 signal peptidase I [Oerskovia enterophila]
MTSNDAERPDDQPRPSGAFPGAPDVESVFPEGQAPSGELGDGSAGAPAPGAAVRTRRRWSFAREVGVIVVAALVISFLIKTFVVQPFVIPSESMENTLIKDDRVLASRFVPRFLDIHRGDVVVFKDPGGWLASQPQQESTGLVKAGETFLTFIGIRPVDAGEHLIKRVIGLPGDHVTCCDAQGRVSVNGVAIDETYIKPGSIPSEIEFDVVVPEGSLFVLGDNRQNSGDSRYNTDKPGNGFVPIDNVVGTAVAKVWPLDRASLMRNPGSVFEDVPEP